MTLSLTTLDVTDRKEKGIGLHNIIVKEAKRASQSSLSIPIPNVLLLTQKQYDDLNNLSKLENMYHSEDKLYVTPYNVMEVRVQNRSRLTFEETNALDESAFNEWEKSIGADNG